MNPKKGIWFIPPIVMQLADGTTMVKPGRAILRARASRVTAMTGVSRHVLAALADCGLIRRCQPSPEGTCYYPGEVEEFILRTENEPGFWTSVRTRAYLRGETLKEAKISG